MLVQHTRTSGEVEWALIIADDGRQLLTLALDHTDRDLEVAGSPGRRTPAPNVLGSYAWVLSEISDHLDQITLRSW